VPWYAEAESEIGIAAAVADQGYLDITFPAGYEYPMPPIPSSMVDDAIKAALPAVPPVDGTAMIVTNTPAGRNSIPYQDRRVCAGNTNCIPICPIQAKYDPTVTLGDALQTGNVTIWYQTVANEVVVGADGLVSAIQVSEIRHDQRAGHRQWKCQRNALCPGWARYRNAKAVAHVDEWRSDAQWGCQLERPRRAASDGSSIYLSWALSNDPYSDIADRCRQQASRCCATAIPSHARPVSHRDRNEGWNFAVGDPTTTTLDFICGSNGSGLNAAGQTLSGAALAGKLNEILTRQFRLGFLMEQTPDDDCAVTLSPTWKDSSACRVHGFSTNFSTYTKMGFVAARKVATAIYGAMGATEYTTFPTASDVGKDPTVFAITCDANGVPVPDGAAPPSGSTTEYFRFFGAGHTVGTYRMGTNDANSVVDFEQRSWDHKNLFLVGAVFFPRWRRAIPR